MINYCIVMRSVNANLLERKKKTWKMVIHFRSLSFFQSMVDFRPKVPESARLERAKALNIANLKAFAGSGEIVCG